MSPPSSKFGQIEAQAQKAENDVSAAETQSSALEAAIGAIEHYMNALKLASSPSDRQRLDVKCKELLRTAEEIKRSKNWSQPRRPRVTPRNPNLTLREPISTRALSNREQIILLEDSKLNGFVFPPWSSEPDPREFELEEDSEYFTDNCNLPLSTLQYEIFDGWKRPSEMLGAVDTVSGGNGANPMMESTQPVDLVQDVTTDCSVVASLCAAISRVERGYSESAAIKFYPSDEQTSSPLLSESGKYIFRMHFNGCYRKVIIDDRLPSSKTSRFLHVVDRNNPKLLWPALVEKAYLKVRGGYDFPGSNSGTDLWVLTGWIPEQIFLHHEDVVSDQLWKRLFKAFNYGDVLITVGTGTLSKREEEELGLVSVHDYAVLDMRENDGRRQLLVKNPWAAGAVWKGIGQSAPAAKGFEQDPDSQENSSISPGTFWTDCDKLLQNFENLYLNWNPKLFAHRQDIHFSWDLSTASSVPGCFVSNPQFSVSSKSGGSVWILLSRHFKTGDYIGSGNDGNDLLDLLSESDEPGFISIYVFKNNGQNVCLSDGALHRGPYVDSPNTLMRFEMPPNTTYTIVAAEQSLRRIPHNFSLSGFSTSPLYISPATEKYAHITKLQSSWTPSTAGGNADSPRYPTNPQFHLTITTPCSIAVLLETSNPQLATHVKVLWSPSSSNPRITSLRTRDIAFDSGDYRRGCALAEHNNLLIGSYTIVCSTFAADQLGAFTLWLKTTHPTPRPRLLPPEHAGRLSITSTPGIFPPGTDRLLAPLTISRLTRAKLIARHHGSYIAGRAVSPSSPLLMTLEIGQGPYKEVLAASGEGGFSDCVSGIRIEEVDLHPGYESRGGLWVVIERVGGSGGQVEDCVVVEVLAEERVGIGEWGVGEG
ncbi:cysteine protease [Onygenales sp. PD_12]|nr:cysteine protease [Onygenales sp. PD_12]KAK2785529.1 cysteine protease [Emmonsiellopsis sp. PD_33]